MRLGSIRQGITWLVVTTSLLLAGFALIVLSLTHIKQLNQLTEQRVADMTQVIANVSSRFLLFRDAEGIDDYFRQFSDNEFLQHIHVYEANVVAEQRALRYFASYNREGLAPIPVRTEIVDEINGLRSNSNSIEMVTPIRIDSEVLGYLYLRADRKPTRELILQTTVTAFVVWLVLALLAWVIAMSVRGQLLRQLDQAVGTIQRITRNRDYSIRLPESNLIELQQLGLAFNTMLARVEQNLVRQQQAEKQALDLNSELERQVQQRTTALREANSELLATLETLHQFQRQQIETEKMSSLGDLIAGVAHEINTPVGLVITSTSILRDKLDLLNEKFNDNSITRADFERFIEASADNLELIQRNIERTADLINQFRQLAMDQLAEEEKTFLIAELCRTVVNQSRQRLPELATIAVHIDCPEELEVTCRMGPLQHVLAELVQNSVIHGFAERHYGEIEIKVVRSAPQQVAITYRDSGSGIPAELERRIFDPFITSRRRKGSTGLGLHLVYNLVTQVLGGTIEVNSKHRDGAEFTLKIRA
jgi:signal transduction histidine kinase